MSGVGKGPPAGAGGAAAGAYTHTGQEMTSREHTPRRLVSTTTNERKVVSSPPKTAFWILALLEYRGGEFLVEKRAATSTSSFCGKVFSTKSYEESRASRTEHKNRPPCMSFPFDGTAPKYVHPTDVPLTTLEEILDPLNGRSATRASLVGGDELVEAPLAEPSVEAGDNAQVAPCISVHADHALLHVGSGGGRYRRS